MEAAVVAVAAIGVGSVGVAGCSAARNACRGRDLDERRLHPLDRSFAVGDTDGVPLSAHLALDGKKNFATLAEGVLLVGRDATHVTEPLLALVGQSIELDSKTVTITEETPDPVALTFETEDEAQRWARELGQWQAAMRKTLSAELGLRGGASLGSSFMAARVAELHDELVRKESHIMSLNERVEEAARHRAEREHRRLEDLQLAEAREYQRARVDNLERNLQEKLRRLEDAGAEEAAAKRFAALEQKLAELAKFKENKVILHASPSPKLAGDSCDLSAPSASSLALDPGLVSRLDEAERKQTEVWRQSKALKHDLEQRLVAAEKMREALVQKVAELEKVISASAAAPAALAAEAAPAAPQAVYAAPPAATEAVYSTSF